MTAMLDHCCAMHDLNALTKHFVGTPYGVAPNGEGEQGRYVQKPLYRFDQFDCVTYVNTLLACYHAEDATSFLTYLKQLNYADADVDYLKRHHFMSADWNPSMEQLGYIKNVTPALAETRTQINKPAWLRAHTLESLYLPEMSPDSQQTRLQELQSQADQLHVVDGVVSYLPIADALQLLADDPLWQAFPDQLLIEIVRPDWDLTEKIATKLAVSHIGFFLRDGDRRVWRHASSDAGAVVEQGLSSYLQAYRNHDTVKGIAIFAINGRH